MLQKIYGAYTFCHGGPVKWGPGAEAPPIAENFVYNIVEYRAYSSGVVYYRGYRVELNGAMYYRAIDYKRDYSSSSGGGVVVIELGEAELMWGCVFMGIIEPMG